MIVNGVEYADYDDYKKQREENQTNDEWRKTCSTEEFAEFLCHVGFENETIVRKFKSEWVEWLKQPHAPQKQDDYPCNVKGCTLEMRQSCCGCPDYFKWKEHHDS